MGASRLVYSQNLQLDDHNFLPRPVLLMWHSPLLSIENGAGVEWVWKKNSRSSLTLIHDLGGTCNSQSHPERLNNDPRRPEHRRRRFAWPDYRPGQNRCSDRLAILHTRFINVEHVNATRPFRKVSARGEWNFPILTVALPFPNVEPRTAPGPCWRRRDRSCEL